jgi:hypothetical protein
MTAARAEFKACVQAVRDKPEYAPLIPYNSDLNSGQLSMALLTDEHLATPVEARLFSARYDETTPCRSHLLTALSTARPDLAPIYVKLLTKGIEITVDVVERKITLGEAARRSQAASADFQQNQAAANREWAADLNASHQAELAQRQAAADAMMQWSLQQQMINAATRPVVTNCNRFGSSVNCTTY